jgi:iron complex outermembrane recepter protein
MSNKLQAQQIIRGKVLDAQTKEYIVGANVMSADKKSGTMTDLFGRSTLKTEEFTDTILIVSLGYLSRSVPVESKELTIQL